MDIIWLVNTAPAFKSKNIPAADWNGCHKLSVVVSSDASWCRRESRSRYKSVSDAAADWKQKNVFLKMKGQLFWKSFFYAWLSETPNLP